MVKMWQEKFYNKQLMGVKMNNPPFETVALSLGCHGIKIDSNTNLKDQLEYFTPEGTPDAVVDTPTA